jgi:hypothetical protein
VILYFAYGSNMNHAHMRGRCPDAQFIAPALVTDWKLDFLYPSTSFPGGGAADIVQSPGSHLWGVAWNISGSDLIKLDDYEDVARQGYRQQKVWINLPDSRQVATTYQVRNKLPATLRPRKDYLQTMLEGASESGLPSDYLDYLADL